MIACDRIEIMNFLRNRFILASILLIIVFFGIQYKDFIPHSVVSPTQNGYTIDLRALNIEIADTEEERNLGLSGRTRLDSNAGLLFVFQDPGEYGFWMKDMKFPIDIIWMDESFTVIDVKEDVKPESFPEIFTPPKNILYVLEVNAGFSRAQGIENGKILDLNFDR